MKRNHEALLVRLLKRTYRPALRAALNHPWLWITLSIILFGVAILAFMQLGHTFLPSFNEGTLTISAVTVPGTSLAESDRLGRRIEEILLSIPEVSQTARRTGRAELDEHVQGVESAEIDVGLRMSDRSKEAMLSDIRRRLTLVPGVNTDIGQPISHRIDHMLSGTRSNVAVKIFGDDLAILRDLVRRVRSAMATVDGVVDLNIEQQADIPMTALTASLALLPLALGGGKPGNEIQAPMALVILFGLLSSMFLNMMVLPAVYFRFRNTGIH